MSGEPLRVAFFPDTYHEIDGVASTSRQYEAFALRRRLPFLTIYGDREDRVLVDGCLTRVARSRGRFGFPLDKRHDFDLAFWRHYRAVEALAREFRPDLVHITGPSDVGQLGALLAHRLGVPLAASWHTNLHEYAEQRASMALSFLPQRVKEWVGPAIRRGSLRATLRFYRIARVLFAPNQELIGLLERETGKPCYLMGRGVETTRFNPQRRSRTDKLFLIGYVGRLTVEKNIRFLAELERALQLADFPAFRFLVVGQGAEESWLRENMQQATFPGVLMGEVLAEAYANMDAFVFPSHTDTYGNVVLEALASGVPAIVTSGGGPRFIVREGETGFVARNLAEFVACLKKLAVQPERLQRMRASARAYAMTASWDSVFESVYAGYEHGMKGCRVAGRDVKVAQPGALAAHPS